MHVEDIEQAKRGIQVSTAKIYVAHAHRNGRDIPGSLIDYLRGEGYDVWWDEDLVKGVPWFDEIVRQIRQRDVLIVFIGQDAQDSHWLARKIDMARGSNMAIIPIVIHHAYDESADKLYIKDYPILHYFGESWETVKSLRESIDLSAKHAQDLRAANNGLIEFLTNSAFGMPKPDKRFECDIFMVMPFDKSLNPVYESVIKPVALDLKLKIKRGDDPFSHHEILSEIWSMIYNCRLVIGDCTRKNPNVFYELGIAHTLGKPVILIAQDIKDITFDIHGRRAIIYEDISREFGRFGAELKRAIQSILELDGVRSDEPTEQ